MSEFGQKIRKARESMGLTLDQIALETRISTRFLRAIENEDFKVLPGGIFNRGFVRAFAQRVGLDPEQAVSDYERIFNQRPVTEPAGTGPLVERSKPNPVVYPLAAGALILAIVIYYLVTRDTPKPVLPDTPGKVAVETAPAVIPAVTAAEPELGAAGGVRRTTGSAPVHSNLDLKIEVHQPTWIRLSSDGIAVVAGEILMPGMTRQYSASASLDLVIGNAAGLTLRINDRQVPSLGDRGQVRSLSITPENVKQITGG